MKPVPNQKLKLDVPKRQSYNGLRQLKKDQLTIRFGLTQKKFPPLALIGAWLLVALPLLVFAALSEDVLEREKFRYDTPTLLWLHAHSNSYLDGAMLFFTQIGGILLLGVAAVWCVVLWFTQRRHDARFVLLAMGGAAALNLLAKSIFARARPALWLSLAPEKDYGFPSGHAMLSSALVLTALVLLWKSQLSAPVKRILTVLGALFVLAVGLSRLYLGVHYPSDILASWMASLAWIALLTIFSRKLR